MLGPIRVVVRKVDTTGTQNTAVGGGNVAIDHADYSAVNGYQSGQWIAEDSDSHAQ